MQYIYNSLWIQLLSSCCLFVIVMIFFQKDKAPKRRSVLDGRLRDERGGGRDSSKGDRPDDERIDRSEISPSRDGSGGDDQLDAYGGHGLHVPSPFPSDMSLPPQVLMPVPGAG